MSRISTAMSLAGGMRIVIFFLALSIETSGLSRRSIPARSRPVTTTSERLVEPYHVFSYTMTSRTVASLDTSLAPTGTQDVDGVRWIVYEGGEDVRPVWTTRLTGPAGPAQIALNGAAGTDEYRMLAEATQTQSPLPAK